MIVRLSELLRLALDSRDAHEVALREELAFLERYLEIEQTRFGPRLVIERDVDDAVLDAKVPNLLLQPLVENAIKHGVERQRRPGVVRLSAHRQDNQVVLTVRDNGPGLNAIPPSRPRSSRGHGIGLSNTRRRLEQLYGKAQELLMREAEGGGTEVIVRLPWRV
jgi:two-component system LytT family sensor kinase